MAVSFGGNLKTESMTREEQMWKAVEDEHGVLSMREAFVTLTAMKWADKNPLPVHIVMRCEEHSDYPEKVFVDKSKAEAYCQQFNDNPSKYSRSVETMEVTL